MGTSITSLYDVVEEEECVGGIAMFFRDLSKFLDFMGDISLASYLLDKKVV